MSSTNISHRKIDLDAIRNIPGVIAAEWTSIETITQDEAKALHRKMNHKYYQGKSSTHHITQDQMMSNNGVTPRMYGQGVLRKKKGNGKRKRSSGDVEVLHVALEREDFDALKVPVPVEGKITAECVNANVLLKVAAERSAKNKRLQVLKK